ncbi:zinc finger MYM-type protein 1-like [Aphis craccivora]|uniref:Zinc finger MYM-type protein 1-like n=1 Tax=Aphis craccivora TaxID=307492 RepID=A0A6G0XZ98_APHCR|nr:zinc finger MYM-type protein 1-like [Aphis craccivora]
MLLSCEKDISLNLDEALDRMGKSSELMERALLFK